MSWQDFDALCAAQNEQMQLSLENEAVVGVVAAINAGSGLREAMTYAIGLVTKEENWLTLVNVLQGKPMALAPDADGVFYKNCPVPLIEEFVGGEKGVLSYLLDRINDPSAQEMELDSGHIRLMHMVIDSLMALKQSVRLKMVVAMFQGICKTRCENGLLPSSVYKKLVDHKMVEKVTYASGNGNNGHLNTRPARRFSNGGNADMGGNSNIPASEPEKVIRDTHSAHPPNGEALPDKGLAAQLAALKPAPAKSETATVQ